jgi:ureidoacrylate peracid hydrolase
MSEETLGGDPGLAPLRHRNQWQFTGDQPGRIDLRRPPLRDRAVTLPTEPATVTFDLPRTVLVVVDLQNDFCTDGGSLASIGVDVSGLRPAIELTARLVPAARAARVPVIWLNWGNRPDQANIPPGVAHVYDPTGQGRGIGSMITGKGAAVLTQGSWGAALVDELAVAPQDIRVDKYRISGFWDTPLDSILRNLRADTLIFAGVNSDQCVYATLIDAACLGYDVIMLTDASATTSPAYCHDAAVYNTRQCFGFTAETAELLAAPGRRQRHLPVCTDLTVAQATAEAAVAEAAVAEAEAVGGANLSGAGFWLLPALAYTKSDEHAWSSGTLWLSWETLMRVLVDIGSSLAASPVRRLVFLNGHGGNSALLQVACRELRRRCGLRTFLMHPGSPVDQGSGGSGADESGMGIHGGTLETSVMLHLRPDLVHLELAERSVPAQLAGYEMVGFGKPVSFGWLSDDFGTNGTIGDPTGATAELGKRVFEAGVRRCAVALGEIARFRPS